MGAVRPEIVTVGVDVGQRIDPSAICVASWDERPLAGADLAEQVDRVHVPATAPFSIATVTRPVSVPREWHATIRHLERLPLGTAYPQVVDRVVVVVQALTNRTGTLPNLYVDATGVGLPVVDGMRSRGLAATPVFLTSGSRRVAEGGEVKLAKAYLVSRLQVLLQHNRLHLPRNRETEALQRELLDFRIQVSEDGADTYGARIGSHDDLVIALGLAVQIDPRIMTAY